MDAATFLGLFLGIGAVFFGNLLEGGHVASLVQGTAAIIVFGGTLGATILSHGLNDVRLALQLFLASWQEPPAQRLKAVAQEIVSASQLARKESVLSLEKNLNSFSSPYMRNVFKYMIDGVEPEALRKIFEPEMRISEDRLLQGAKVWSDAGGFAPTIGILGAVLGLIHVMANLSDTSALGQGIAVAFVATIYGVGSANLIFIPISNRIKKQIHSETEVKEMILEGAIGISSGLNPYIVEEKMRLFSRSTSLKDQRA